MNTNQICNTRMKSQNLNTYLSPRIHLSLKFSSQNLYGKLRCFEDTTTGTARIFYDWKD